MKAIVFGAGIAVGYVLGARAGRGSYEQLKNRARQFWESPKVQEKVSEATAAVKEKAPEAPGQLKEAVKKAGGSISGALHRSKPSGTAPEHGSEPAHYSGQPVATVENPATAAFPESGTPAVEQPEGTVYPQSGAPGGAGGAGAPGTEQGINPVSPSTRPRQADPGSGN
jgi:hypothetical protein